MTQKQTARDKLKVALADLLRVPPDDPTLDTAADACEGIALSLYQVIQAEHGSVTIDIKEGLFDGHSIELTYTYRPPRTRPKAS